MVGICVVNHAGVYSDALQVFKEKIFDSCGSSAEGALISASPWDQKYDCHPYKIKWFTKS